MLYAILGYALVGLPLWRRFAGFLAAPWVEDRDQSYEWGFGAFFGGLGALIWPLVALVLVLAVCSRQVERMLLRHEPRLLMSKAERKARRLARERAIERAEKEVGLR